jgi:hypothetical protein
MGTHGNFKLPNGKIPLVQICASKMPVESHQIHLLKPQELANLKVRIEINFERHRVGGHSIRQLKIARDLSLDPELVAIYATPTNMHN